MNFSKVCINLILLASLLAWQPPAVQAASGGKTFNIPQLTPAWTSGIIFGGHHLHIEDLNHDGKNETTACAGGIVYVIIGDATGAYNTLYYDPNLNCVALATGDRDGDGVRELYIATSDGKVILLRGGDFTTLATLNLPGGVPSQDIAVADVNGDGKQEILLVTNADTLVYDATTLALDWQTTAYVGNQIAVGDVDGDGQPEIIVNGADGYVLDGNNGTLKWSYPGGFGSMAVGDLDGDHLTDIVGIDSQNNIFVVDGDTQTILWKVKPSPEVDAIAVADVTGNGDLQVLVGAYYPGYAIGLRGSDGATLWSIYSGDVINGITAGDFNNDGVNEIVWGSINVTIVGSWVSQKALEAIGHLAGPLDAAAGDIDLDGREEIATITSSTNPAYQKSTLSIVDGKTHLVKWSTPAGRYDTTLQSVAIGQLDSDPALEILVVDHETNSESSESLQVYDGISHALEWQSTPIHDTINALLLKDINGDGIDEIILGLQNGVEILAGAPPVILWQTTHVGALDLSLGHLENSTSLDLAVCEGTQVQVFEMGSWTMVTQHQIPNSTKVAILESPLGGVGKLVFNTVDDNYNYTLVAMDGSTFYTYWKQPLGKNYVYKLLAQDIDGDGLPEIVVLGWELKSPATTSLLWIGNEGYNNFWKYKMESNWGTLYDMQVSDVDGDGQPELLLSGKSVIQVDKLTTTPVTYYYNYSPVAAKIYPWLGMWGFVTEKGAPAAGVPLQLRFYNGKIWSTQATTHTASDGHYTFTGVLALQAGQLYYVRFQNTAKNTSRLYVWETRSTTRYRPGDYIHMGDFDLENVDLGEPAPGEQVALPYPFHWSTRHASPSDLYEVYIWEVSKPSVYFIGGSASNIYILQTLPAGFTYRRLCGWEVFVLSPDGGMGVSYYAYGFYFIKIIGPSGLIPQVLPPISLPGQDGW